MNAFSECKRTMHVQCTIQPVKFFSVHRIDRTVSQESEHQEGSRIIQLQRSPPVRFLKPVLTSYNQHFHMLQTYGSPLLFLSRRNPNMLALVTFGVRSGMESYGLERTPEDIRRIQVGRQVAEQLRRRKTLPDGTSASKER